MLLAGEAVEEYWILPSMLNANPRPVPNVMTQTFLNPVAAPRNISPESWAFTSWTKLTPKRSPAIPRIHSLRSIP